LANWKIVSLVTVLVVSITLNIYLIQTVKKWQEAWLEQKMTTSYVEHLFRTSGADISFEGISRQLESEFGNVKKIETTVPSEVFNGAYEYSLVYDETEFLFNKEAIYAGSLPKLPKNLLSTGIWFGWRDDY
jgi:hypothetical protein